MKALCNQCVITLEELSVYSTILCKGIDAAIIICLIKTILNVYIMCMTEAYASIPIQAAVCTYIEPVKSNSLLYIQVPADWRVGEGVFPLQRPS